MPTHPLWLQYTGQFYLQQKVANLSKGNPKFMGLVPESHNSHAPAKNKTISPSCPLSNQAVAQEFALV